MTETLCTGHGCTKPPHEDLDPIELEVSALHAITQERVSHTIIHRLCAPHFALVEIVTDLPDELFVPLIGALLDPERATKKENA